MSQGGRNFGRERLRLLRGGFALDSNFGGHRLDGGLGLVAPEGRHSDCKGRK